MKKKYIKITATIIIVIFSICTLVFADNNLIGNNLILDSNNIIDNETINNTLIKKQIKKIKWKNLIKMKHIVKI